MKEARVVQISAVDSTMYTMLTALNKGIIDAGYSLTAVCSKGEFTEAIKEEGINIINIEIQRRIQPIENIKTLMKLYKLLKKINPHIVHVHTPVAAVLGRIAAKLCKTPIIIYTAHGFYFHENMRPLVYKMIFNIERFFARYFTDILFTQSQEDCRTSVEGRFKEEDKIIAIGNGVDLLNKFNPENISMEERKSIRKEFKLEENIRVVTFIGRLIEEKGILDLLKASEDMEGENIKFLIVGRLEDKERDVKTLEKIKEYYNHPNIIFTGRREDISRILSITDIFCLPSFREGMPRSIIEAMAMECAVITTDTRGCREEIINEKNGYLVNINSPKEIKEKIQFLYENPEILNSMKKCGRERALNLYNESKVIELQLKIYKDILKEKNIIN
ncbi:glycosyltransferase family 4 protein [Clostridium polynesiense]|uniref:glycosyltransferase family 4 protein n=1 Tax=Clostridium polynesiense TaxID=1325933 RepID=UPI00058B607B|nr:glycosyltransferase family 4 protein [Clostridium polynesiense]